MKTLGHYFIFIAGLILLGFQSCSNDNPSKAEKNAESYSSEVVVKWLNLQLKMLRVPLTAGAGTQASERAQAYCGIALYESIVSGMPTHKSLQGQLTDFPAMPAVEEGKEYHWAAVANAALAEMNRKLFPTASAANKSSLDSLESTLLNGYNAEADANAETITRSVAYGKAISSAVYTWASTDGSANVNPPYVPSGAAGTWVSTPPNFPAAAIPYASQRRLMVTGSSGVTLEPLPAYSAVVGSPFYNMVKDVFDKSQVLTAEQKAMAIYHRDAPGYPGGGHFVAVLSQVFTKASAKLDVAAMAYAKTGIAQSEATIMCFRYKYSFNVVRPISYIQNEMEQPTWSAQFNTPGHPEFPSAHAVNGAAVAEALTNVFGDNFQFTLSTYDYLGLPARNYNSFKEMAKEMADSRVFGGIHYQASCDKGRALGEQIAKNILSKVDF